MLLIDSVYINSGGGYVLLKYLVEILTTQICLVDKDIKISYNKVLAKSEVEIKIVYLTED